MGFFDFLKKKELAEIKRLTKQVEQYIKDNGVLKDHLDQLKRYECIVEANKEAIGIISNAEENAKTIIINAEKESKEILCKAEFELNRLNLEIEQLNKEASEIIRQARAKANVLKESAELTLDKANSQANKIVSDAQTRAEEIAGDAYRAMQEANNLEKTIQALKNTLKGYGNEYIIPTYTLLDQLAEDFGYTEAGTELKLARERSRLMVKSGRAAKCDYVEDNRRITAIEFTTDAFNGKVDTILSSIREDNYGVIKQKIIDSFNLVNNLGKPFKNARITQEYLHARLEELKWSVIVIELRNKQREEQRQIKEQIREEEKARKEFEKAIKDAEKEETVLKKAMDKALKELETASETQKIKYEQKLEDLRVKLDEAEKRSQRALSMAQQTKSGHVYVISNIGSFGENIFKIGMTRRLEPIDRVKELGDASVPFSFDIHALIYSEDAPSLENELHRFFMDNQVNKVNSRKEFFRINLKEIKNKVEAMNLNAKWTMIAQATEYRESIVIEENLKNAALKREWEETQLKQMEAIPEDVEYIEV